jgi:acetyl-CoA acyltransferase
VPQGISAEEIAKNWNIGRAARRVLSKSTARDAAIDGGRFEQEIVPVTLPDGATFAVDETRRDTSAERSPSSSLHSSRTVG